jgi:mannose-6-phosphate isomerase-like protein (cupin superfamily)
MEQAIDHAFDDALRDTLLEPLLAPITTAEFLESSWEQHVLHIQRKDANRYTGLLSIEAIESVLSCQRLTLADAQLSGGPDPVPPEHYLDDNGHVVGSKLIQGHRNGATLVLSHMDRRLEPLAGFCRDVQSGLAMRCQTNAYLSPAGQQGFNPHYDSHDVFILQVQGKKTFHFYAGGPVLPAHHHRFDAEQHPPGQQQSSIELSAGDALYIPRGVMHDAVAHPDTPSLHITLGLFALLSGDVLHEVLRLAESDDASLRTSIAGRFNHHGSATDNINTHEQVRDHIRELMARAVTDERIDQALRKLRDDMALEARPNCNGRLGQASAQKAIGTITDSHATSPIQMTVYKAAWLDIEDTGDAVLLRAPGSVLTFEGRNAAAIRRLAHNESLNIADLGDDAASAQALAHLLEEHGLILPSS